MMLNLVGLIQEEMITIEEIGKKENKKEEEQKVRMTYLHPKRIKDTAGNNRFHDIFPSHQ